MGKQTFNRQIVYSLGNFGTYLLYVYKTKL